MCSSSSLRDISLKSLSVRQSYDEEYSNELQQARDSISLALSRNIRGRRIYKRNKKKKCAERQKLPQTTRYFMFLRPSIPAPFPERFLVADYFRDLVFQ